MNVLVITSGSSSLKFKVVERRHSEDNRLLQHEQS